MLKFKGMKFRHTKDNLPIIVLAVTIVCLLFGIVTKQTGIFASAVSSDSNGNPISVSEHYITIYDGDQKTTFRSNATTVGDALDRAKISINDGDIVEPKLEEVISEENYNINIYRARQAMVLDGQTLKYVKTASTDPIKVAEAAGVKILEADIVNVEPYNNLLESGMTSVFKVYRAKTIKFNFYGKNVEVRTQAKTVGDFLTEHNIDRNPDVNWISASANTAITDGITLSVFRQGKQTVVVDETINFSEKTTYDYALDYGKREITKPGQNGSRTVTYEIDMKDGKELSRKVVSSIVTKEPVTQEVKIGMNVVLPAGTHEDWMAAAGISPSDYGYVNFIIERESHWNPLSRNVSSGAYGLCQALPGKKMASAGADWETNPITQLKWCNGYVYSHGYGSWQGAWAFWQEHHWW